MKILQVYKDYFPVIGGMENHIRLIVRGMRQRHPDMEMTVLVTNTTRNTLVDEDDGTRIVKAGRLANISSAPISLSLFNQMRKLSADADLVHMHFPYPIGELAYLIAGHNKPSLISYHSDIVRQKYLLQVYKPFMLKLLARAKSITTSNPNYIQSSPYLKPHEAKCVVIPHGAELDQFVLTPAVQVRVHELRAQYSGPIVLFIGLLRYYKGVAYLIKAMQQVPNAQLLIVGKGPEDDALRAQTHALGLEQKVHFLGRVSDEDRLALYHACDIFCLPSIHRSESWGAVQVEALACGKPIVSTELGTGTSWVNQNEQTGLVVQPMDAQALAAALNRLLADPALRQRMGKAGKSRAAQELDANVMIDRLAVLYRNIVASR